MNYTLITYSIYLPVTIGLTIWVARTLLNNSKVFLVDIFHGQEELAAAVNRLLQIGFYLIALGTSFLKLEIETERTYTGYNNEYVEHGITNAQQVIEALSYKVGGFTLILGFLLFFNFFILLILRAGSRSKTLQRIQQIGNVE